MDFLRPEAKATLLRWREVLIAAGLALVGLWLLLAGLGPQRVLGGVMLAVAAALAWNGRQRARFRGQEIAPGVVQVTEGRIAYFGPLEGGVADFDALAEVRLEAGYPGPVWLILSDGADPLRIPTGAKGAEALLDVFAHLPGFRTEAMLDALRSPPDEAIVLWRATHRPDPPRLA